MFSNIISCLLSTLQADILVASCSSNLDLQRGGASKSLLATAGTQLQDELRHNRKEIKNGEIVMLKGYQLECSSVILTALPNWTSDSICSQVLNAGLTLTLSNIQ